ncbi:MAG: hypothetical protein D4R64_11995 [Porphyromonadaceae bacterium]|nr:MAG: hypothetical protein D4R64_11995 [Porphyromonadaceae bacterium]
MCYPRLNSNTSLINLIILVILIPVFTSCSSHPKRKNENPIARAYGNYLYKSDIQGLLPTETTPEDSSRLVKSYIALWMKKKAVVNKAEFNLTEAQKNIENLLDEYRTSLLTYEYEKQMVEQKLDTVLSDSEVQTYYYQYKQNFLLQDPIIKGVYFRILRSSSRLREFRDLAHSYGDLAYKRLVDLGAQVAEYTESFEENWLSFPLLMQKMPGTVQDPKLFLQRYKYLEAEDDHYFHFARIIDYKLPGESAPLDFVTQEIRDVLLNKRKMDFLKQLEESIYNEAVIQNDVEVYEK